MDPCSAIQGTPIVYSITRCISLVNDTIHLCNVCWFVVVGVLVSVVVYVWREERGVIPFDHLDSSGPPSLD